MPKTLAQKIVEKRTSLQLNQYQAAFQINISPAKLQQIEQGYDEKRLTKKVADRVNKWLNSNGK